MDNRVGIAKCASYDQAEVDAAVARAFELLGGLSTVVKPGMRVAIKANLLRKSKPQDSVTTHPAVIAAVAKQCVALGAQVVIGDSPGGPFTTGMLTGIYRECGMDQAAKDSGAMLNENTNTVDVVFLEGEILKQFTLCEFLAQADVIINVAKLKTHGLTTYTGAVKNLFGAIPGTVKVEYHFRMPQPERFSNMLVDINEYLKPAFSLIDAVVGMEGEGPASGRPRAVGCLIAATSPHAADMAGVTLINQPPASIHTLQNAMRRGLLPQTMGEMEVVGDAVEPLIVRDFDVPTVRQDKVLPRFAPAFVMNFVQRRLQPKPVFMKSTCIGCGECARSCPPKAIAMADKLPKVELDKCIRCFCCQELCPKHAVKIKRSRLLKWMG